MRPDEMEFAYAYPANMRALTANEYEQAQKVLEEAMEAVRAVVDGEEPERILEELEDVLQAVEGLERKYPTHMVASARRYVYAKGLARGDYR